MFKFFIICLVCIIAGCSSSSGLLSQGQTISFDRYILKRSSDYIAADPVLIDNQQILNQILGVYEYRGDTFTKNLIISTSKIKNGLDGIQFMTLNADKIKTEISGLISDGYEEVIIECNDEEFTAYLHQLHLDHNGSSHQMLQLYRVSDGQGYIASAYTDDNNDNEEYKKYFKTLTCK